MSSAPESKDPAIDRDRTRERVRALAAEYLGQGDPIGWFEPFYQEAAAGKTTIYWADFAPNPNLLDFWQRHPIAADGKSALVVGCGYGDDAEQIARWGFETTAFDISSTAIKECRKRFPNSPAHYTAANLLEPPLDWIGRFDFVFDAYTVQVLPPDVRRDALEKLAGFVKPGGLLLVIARGRDEDEPVGQMPWPLTLSELEPLGEIGLSERNFEDYFDRDGVRRFRVLYQKPPLL